MFVSLAAIGANVALKLLLWRDFGAAGLALATAAGAWINVATLFVLGIRRGWAKPDPRLGVLVAVTLAAALVAGVTARLAAPSLLAATAGFPHEPRLVAVASVSVLAALLYAAVLAFGLKLSGTVRLLR
jgi:putative peptidoglycan lipid II flippase